MDDLTKYTPNIKTEKFFLKGGLNKEQIYILHERALDLIESVGIEIPHKGILDLLSNCDGVKINQNNARFRNDLVTNALNSMKYPLPDYVKDKWAVLAGAHQTKIFDLNSRKLRSTNLHDLINTIKLADALDAGGAVPVVPLDMPVYLREILMHKIAWEYSRFYANDLFEHNPKSTAECANYIYEMSKVADKWFALGLYMISPRSFDYHELDVIYNFLEKGVPMWAGTMPIAGINAPITMLGAMLQSIYETLACLTMLNLINRKTYNYIQVIDSFIAHPFDMKFANFVYGTPEDIQCALYKIAIHDYYKIPVVVKSLVSEGKEPDAQSAFEIAVFTLITALAGARIFRAGGLLSADEVFSAEMLIIEHEIIEYIKNVLIKEDSFDEESLMVDEIAAVGPGESFIDRESTLKKFKKEYWEPELFIRPNLKQWVEKGSISTLQRANMFAKDKIKQHEYIIEHQKKKELEKIFECAKNDEKLEQSYK